MNLFYDIYIFENKKDFYRIKIYNNKKGENSPF